MKYLLLVVLLTLTPQILNKEITIDLENKGRVGSEFTKKLAGFQIKNFSIL
jgi:hypothetical protein